MLAFRYNNILNSGFPHKLDKFICSWTWI